MTTKSTIVAWVTTLAISAAIVSSAGGNVDVGQNIAFNVTGKNPWGPGNAIEFAPPPYTLLDVPYTHVDLPPINASPTDAALDALGQILGISLPSILKLQVGGSVSGSAHVSAEVFASLGRLNINYPGRAGLNLQTSTSGALDYVQSKVTYAIGSSFQPGVNVIQVSEPLAIGAGGAGYGETQLSGISFTRFSAPAFVTTAPYAEAKLVATADVRAGVFTKIRALGGLIKARKDFNFGGPIGGPIVEINPTGLFVFGEDTGLFNLTQPINIPISGVGTATVTYPNLTVSGGQTAPGSAVLRGQHESEVLRLDTDIEKLIPVIGPILHNSFGPLSYDLAHLGLAPKISVYQDMTFTPDPRVRLNFSEPVIIDGQATTSKEFALGAPINWTPMFSNSSQITISPQYILKNTFRNETGLDLSVDIDFNALSLKAPFIPGTVGPLIDPPPQTIEIGRLPLVQPQWEINLGNVIGGPITVPKFNTSPRLDDLQLSSASLISGTLGSGAATYDLHFTREVVGGPPQDYEAMVTGVGSLLHTPSGDAFVDSGIFKAAQDILLTDPVTSEQYNIGRDVCLYGCDLVGTLPAVNPAFFDTNDPGQTDPLYVTALPTIPDTSVDVAHHPILGHPDLSQTAVNHQFESGADVTDIRNGPAITILARSKEILPDATGEFAELGPVSMNSDGRVALQTLAMNTPMYLADDGAKTKLVRNGDSIPGGGTIALRSDFLRNSVLTAPGKVVFVASSNDGNSVKSALFTAGPAGLAQIAREGQVAPGGGTFGTLALPSSVYRPAINNLGNVAFVAGAVVGFSTQATALYVGDGTVTTQIARKDQTAPQLAGHFNDFREPVINDASKVAFVGITELGENGLYRTTAGGLSAIAVSGEIAPDGSQFHEFNSLSMNSGGEIAFRANIDSFQQGIYKWNGSQVVPIANTESLVDPAFGSESVLQYPVINDLGSVAFSALYSIYLHTNTGNSRIAEIGMHTTDGRFIFNGEGAFGQTVLNNQNQIAFLAGTVNQSFQSFSHGIFVYDGTNLVEVALEGQSLAGSVITQLSMPALNDQMQVAYQAHLADGRDVIARFEPTICWHNLGSGAWAAGGNWSLGVEPTNPYDVIIAAEDSLTVTGPTVNRTVKSLDLGSLGLSAAKLSLQAGITLTATHGTTIGPLGVLSGFGTLAGSVLNDGGTIAPGASPGMLTFDGDCTIDHGGLLEIEVAGLGAGQFDVLNVTGDLNLNDALIDFKFINGFLPKAGDTFAFLNVLGNFQAVFAATEFEGVAPGFDYTIDLLPGGGLSFRAINDAAPVPEPTSIMIAGIGLAGGGLLVRRYRPRWRRAS